MTLTSVIPNRFQQNNKAYAYKVPFNFPISFFLNTDNVITGVTFSNLSIGMFDAYGNEIITFSSGELQKVDLTGGYRLYVEDLSVDEGDQYGIYYFVIYDNTDDSVLFILNCFQLVPSSEAGNYTQISYRHSTNLFNYNYEELPFFRSVFFLDLNQVASQPEYEFNGYSEATTGFQRNAKSQLKDTVTLEATKFDEIANEGMTGLSLHDDIEINFRPFQVKEGYEIDENRFSRKKVGRIIMYDQEKNQINLNGKQTG